MDPVEDVGGGLAFGGDRERAGLRSRAGQDMRMSVRVVVQVHPPGERAGGKRAILNVVAGARVVDDRAGRVGGAAHWLGDARRGHRVLRDGELCGLARRGAKRVSHHDIEECAAVGELDIGARVARPGRARDRSGVAAPLIREGRASCGTDAEGRRLPDADRAAHGLQLDGRRLGRGVAGCARRSRRRARGSTARRRARP